MPNKRIRRLWPQTQLVKTEGLFFDRIRELEAKNSVQGTISCSVEQVERGFRMTHTGDSYRGHFQKSNERAIPKQNPHCEQDGYIRLNTIVSARDRQTASFTQT